MTDKFEEQKNTMQKQIDELNKSITDYKENNKIINTHYVVLLNKLYVVANM